MADAAVKMPRFTVDEFLRIDDFDERWRYELIDGQIVAMSPPGGRHQILHSRLIAQVQAAVDRHRPQCTVRAEAGIRPDPARNDTLFQADLAVTCGGLDDPTSQVVAHPVLIAEVQSPTTWRVDLFIKRPAYRTIGPPLYEILFVSTEAVTATLLSRSKNSRSEDGRSDDGRSNDGWTEVAIRGDAILSLDSVGLSIPLIDLYAGTGLTA